MRIRSASAFAIGLAVLFAQTGIAQDVTRDALLSAPMPRTEGGHPDLTGLWVAGVPGAQSFSSTGPGGAFYVARTDDGSAAFQVRDNNFFWVEIDQEIFIKSDRENMPMYRPEYWEPVRWNEEFGYERPADPGYGCKEKGIVKRGFPHEIIHLQNKILLLYGGAPPAIREIPLDGRPLRTPDEYEGLNQLGGSSVGHWEGDTLVIETVDFPEELIWYSTRGWPMSADAKITERFTRQGNVLTLAITVDDPAFIEPWEVRPIERQLNMDPDALFPSAPVCIELVGDSISGERFNERFRQR
jgi:hypothetical protein